MVEKKVGRAPEPPKHMPAVKIPTIAGTLTTSAATPMAIANAVIKVTCWVGAGGWQRRRNTNVSNNVQKTRKTSSSKI
jgi:hypothetical protein